MAGISPERFESARKSMQAARRGQVEDIKQAITGPVPEGLGRGDDAVVFDWEPTIEAGAELLSGPRGDDMRIPRGWEKYDEEAIDQLDDDELAQQWEYNVVDPTNPQISTSTSEKS